jgi:hypothetical protein
MSQPLQQLAPLEIAFTPFPDFTLPPAIIHQRASELSFVPKILQKRLEEKKHPPLKNAQLSILRNELNHESSKYASDQELHEILSLQ